MEPRVSIITLGVADFPKSFRFYRDGLGFTTKAKESDGIAWFSTTSGVLLGLYPIDRLAADIGPDVKPRKGFSGITLAHNVRKKEEVAQLLAFAKEAGATVVKPAQDVFWGGHAGYFTDPDGYHWEIAWNPGSNVGRGGKSYGMKRLLSLGLAVVVLGLAGCDSMPDPGDKFPLPVFRPPPQYPFEARRDGITGSATVDFIVDPNGNVVFAEASSATRPDFGAAAVAAVYHWKFEPAIRHGQPVNAHLQIPISFSLTDN